MGVPNRCNVSERPVVVPSGIAVATVAEPLSPITLTEPVTHSSKPNSLKWQSMGRAYGIPPVCSRLVVTPSVANLKKKSQVMQVNPNYVNKGRSVRLKVDEMWSFVSCKRFPRWLWWVEDAASGEVVAFVFGRRTHATFKRLLALLETAQIQVSGWITDAWWAYYDCLDQTLRVEAKALLQSLERKHLTLRTRLKRLTRRTICFSKSVVIHDTLIGLFINHYFFNLQHS